MSGLLILDDRDRSITYNGAWFPGGLAGYEYSNTTTYTLSNGASASLPFYGSSIAVIGTTKAQGAAGLNRSLDITFTISDGKVATTTTVFLPQPEATTYNVKLFQSDELPLASYKLTLQHTTPQDGFMCLDAFYVGGHDMFPATSKRDSTKSVSVVAIVLGAILCLCLVLCIFLWTRLRSLRKSQSRGSEMEVTQVAAFERPPSPRPQSQQPRRLTKISEKPPEPGPQLDEAEKRASYYGLDDRELLHGDGKPGREFR